MVAGRGCARVFKCIYIFLDSGWHAWAQVLRGVTYNVTA